MSLSLRISVSHLHTANAFSVLTDFITSLQTKYPVQVNEQVPASASHCAEAVITVPFSARESARIDFNIFAAQFEADHPEEQDVYFKMESETSAFIRE